MIQYENRGIAIFFMMLSMRGSVIPRTSIVAIFSCLISLILTLLKYKIIDFLSDEMYEVVFGDQWMSHSFAPQSFASLLGLCIVFRTNMALARYDEGIANVQDMVSKWSDAFMQASAYAGSSQSMGADENILMAWRRQQAHWFSLMSAIAVCTLRGESGMDDEGVPYLPLMPREIEPIKYVDFVGGDFVIGLNDNHGPPTGEDGAMLNSSPDKPAREIWEKDEKYRSEKKKQILCSTLRWLLRQFWESKLWPKLTATDTEALAVVYLTPITVEEQNALDYCQDKVLLLTGWITESITRVIAEKHIMVPPPICSRFYQELSDGLLAYNQAMKIALVPFPFPFAQIVTLLLIVFVLTCPLLIMNFTDSPIFTPVLTFLAVLGYWGLNEIACELENPFGNDSNDLPLLEIHHDFVDAVEEQFMPLPQNMEQLYEELDSEYVPKPAPKPKPKPVSAKPCALQNKKD